MTQTDNVKHPNHYQGREGMEAIDVIRNFLSPEEFRGYLRGNMLKYDLRADHKNGEEDYKKAQVYRDWLVAFDALPPLPPHILEAASKVRSSDYVDLNADPKDLGADPYDK